MSTFRILPGLILPSLTLLAFLVALSCRRGEHGADTGQAYAGSESCRECHESFFELWAPSRHGKAMQPVERSFLTAESLPDTSGVEVGGKIYEVLAGADSLLMLEKDKEGNILARLPGIWSLGGKNVFYFLTPAAGGRLQTLPLAFNVHSRRWYNNPESGVRHFPDRDTEDEALDWRHSLFTFNTTCHSCHVSQLEKNYNPGDHSYRTLWKEPGINCETCHGPSQGHIAVMRKAERKGVELPPDEWGLIITSSFSPEQHNSSCSSCHAKMSPLTASYPPGAPFYDHFNLITLENPDYYPDGRDLGENYTYTTWSMNPCKAKSEMHCVSCHTSSGRYRFAREGEANKACMPCHAEQVDNFTAHSRHRDSGEVTCVTCHMPKTMFAAMERSDHSMRPPNPAATLAFGSPNACNLCHQDQSAEWAEKQVSAWHGKDRPQPDIHYGRLIQAARDRRDFSRADEMLAMIAEGIPNEIFAASMIRILEGRDLPGLPGILQKAALESPSALVRSAAADGLRHYPDLRSKQVLLQATADSFRVVRVSAASSLAPYPDELFSEQETVLRNRAFDEYRQSVLASPDQWSAHYNLGNFSMNRGDLENAIRSFETASFLEPEVISPYVNVALAQSRLGRPTAAEINLKKALKVHPLDPAANFNYGLLLGEMGRLEEAKAALRTALKADPSMAAAAHNLGIMAAASGEDSLQTALAYCKMASELAPAEARYAYTYAYYLEQAGRTAEALASLRKTIGLHPDFVDAYALAGQLYLKSGDKAGLKKLFSDAVNHPALAPETRQALNEQLQQLQ
jgi:tetratricopeptide (TPR) repeat protein